MNLTEHTFRYQAIAIMNRIIKASPDLQETFDTVDSELSLPVSNKTLFLDGLIWKNKQQHHFALSFETKQPKWDASDWELVDNAFQKAATLGVDYFATWNVCDLILWKTHESQVPLMQRQKMVWRNIVNLPNHDLNEVDTEENWQKIEKFLEQFLRTLQQILLEPQKFIGLPIDDFFVFKLQKMVQINSPVFAHALQQMSLKDISYYKQLIHWVSQQGWNSAIENRQNAEQVSFHFYRRFANIAVFLLINKIIFYNRVQAHYSDNLGKMAIKANNGAELQAQLQYYFNQVLQIDYQPVFSATVFDELPIPDNAIEQLVRLIHDLNRYDFSRLSYEIIGQVYENLIPLEDRHEMGQYFTPSNRVDLIVGFCVRHPDAIVSDWSCGAGTFLVRSYSRLKYLAQQAKITTHHKKLLEQLWGCDIAKFPTHLAMINLAMLDLSEKENFPYIKNCDAFDIFPRKAKFQVPQHHGVKHQFNDISGTQNIEVTVPSFDATVGNPPYIRQELIEGKNKLADILLDEWGKHFVLNKQSDIYAYFFFHSAAFLQEGGRLGFVTSNSWLDVRYGAMMQAHFCQQFKIIAIISSQVERDFAQADINSVITIIERCSDETARKDHCVKFVTLKRIFEFLLPPRKMSEDDLRWQDVDWLVAKIEKTDVFYEDDHLRIFPVNQQVLYLEGLEEDDEADHHKKPHYVGSKWGGKYLRAPDIFFTILQKGKALLVPLKQVAEIKRGFTTGANEFFYLTDNEIAGWGIESEFLRPVIKSPREAHSISIDPNRLKYKILLCHETRKKLKGKNILKYIEWGESKGFHLRPTCQSRSYWYDLGERELPKINCNYLISEMMRFYHCPQGLLSSDNFQHIYSKLDTKLLSALATSTLFSLFLNLTGRNNFGGGLLKIQTYEIGNLEIINPNFLSKNQRSKIEIAFHSLSQRPINSIFQECGITKLLFEQYSSYLSEIENLPDPVPPTDRQALDDIIFDILGLSRLERKQIYWEVCRLVYQRVYSKPDSIKKSVKIRQKEFDPEVFADYALEELEKILPSRHFPQDFVETRWHTQTIVLPEFDKIETLRMDEFFGKALLIVNEHTIDCTTTDKARFVQYAIQANVRRQVMVPKLDNHARQACDDYQNYQRQFQQELEELLKHENLTKKQIEQVKQVIFKKLPASKKTTQN